MDDAGSEHAGGWVLVRDGLDRSGRRGRGARERGAARPRRRARHARSRQHAPPPLPDAHARARRRTRRSSNGSSSCIRCGRGLDAEAEYAAARTGLAELALSGCSTVFDHHYVFPRGRSGILEAELQAARELGLRFVASRGSMDLGASHGGLPPDSLVETLDEILTDTERVAALGRRRPSADRGRTVLAVLGHASADGRVCRARTAPRPAAAHAPGRDGRRGRVLPRALRLHARRVPDRRRLAGRRRLVRALRARRRRRPAPLREARRRRGPLPRLEPAPRRRGGAGARDARRRRPRRPRRRRLGLERARRPACSRSSRRCSSPAVAAGRRP